jgi:hypothetical protein
MSLRRTLVPPRSSGALKPSPLASCFSCSQCPFLLRGALQVHYGLRFALQISTPHRVIGLGFGLYVAAIWAGFVESAVNPVQPDSVPTESRQGLYDNMSFYMTFSPRMYPNAADRAEGFLNETLEHQSFL